MSKKADSHDQTFNEVKNQMGVDSEWLLPNGWSVEHLANFIDLETGKRLKGGGLSDGDVASIGGEHLTSKGQISFIKNRKFISEEFYDGLKQGKIRQRDVLLVKDGATTGKAAYVENLPFPKVAVNEHVFILRSKFPEKLDNEYLFYFLRSLRGQEQIRKQYHGLIGGVNRQDVKSIRIDLPPLFEQQRIASVLRIIQKAREATEKVIAATRQLKASLMKHLFTYGPVPVDEAEQAELKETEIGLMPASWKLLRVGEIDFDISDGNYASKYPKRADFVIDGIPFIRANNLQDGRVVWTDMRFIANKQHEELRKGHLKAGDVLIVTRGAGLGKIALVSDEFIGANINAQIVRINARDKVCGEFFFYSLMSNKVQNAMQSLATGSTFPQLPIGKLKMLPLPIPPMDEQRRIAKILVSVDEKIKVDSGKELALQQTLYIFLAHLMTGKIRVKDLEVPDGTG